MKILVLNAGSSSLKYQLINMSTKEGLVCGLIAKIGEAGSTITNHFQAIKLVQEELTDGENPLLKSFSELASVGHRVVHGGETFSESTLITDDVISCLEELYPLAPLHNPANVSGIKAMLELLPNTPQVAVFDTEFHSTLPDYAYTYAIPTKYYVQDKIRKYGFHGTSHKYVAQQAAKILKKDFKEINLITCHLGNGCSLAAIQNGESVDTSMGFTPLDGLVMGTRSGSIDPSIPLFIADKYNLSSNEVNNILNKQSGLLGISGISNDLRTLLASNEESAKKAIKVFCYTIKKQLGAYISVLGKVDAIVFTGGIGENSAVIRDSITSGIVEMLSHKPEILVIKTNEELMIANKTLEVISNQ
jgi:acetate kinase